MNKEELYYLKIVPFNHVESAFQVTIRDSKNCFDNNIIEIVSSKINSLLNYFFHEFNSQLSKDQSILEIGKSRLFSQSNFINILEEEAFFNCHSSSFRLETELKKPYNLVLVSVSDLSIENYINCLSEIANTVDRDRITLFLSEGNSATVLPFLLGLDIKGIPLIDVESYLRGTPHQLIKMIINQVNYNIML